MTLESIVHPQILEFLEATARSAPPGDFAEVGVYKGGSAEVLYRIAEERGKQLFLFDTFTGIPRKDPGDQHEIGDFDAGGADAILAIREAMPRAHLIVGDIEKTPEIAFILMRRPLAFVHVDCDQYGATLAAIRHLRPRMAKGGIMVFDDYWCLESATRAVNESFPPEMIQATPSNRAMVVF